MPVDKNKIRTFISNVRQEIKNIQVGEGKFTRTAIHFDKGEEFSPVMVNLKRFEDNPTKNTFDTFIEIASQDLGITTGDGFKTWGSGLFPDEDKSKEKGKPVRSLSDTLYNAVYEIFRASNTPLDQKQVERLERAVRSFVKILDDNYVTKEEANKLEKLLKSISKNIAEVSKSMDSILKRVIDNTSQIIRITNKEN